MLTFAILVVACVFGALIYAVERLRQELREWRRELRDWRQDLPDSRTRVIRE